MSISSAISNAQNKVAAAYTALSNKGATLPATQNLSNMPSCINSIQSTFTTSNFYINDKMRIENGAIYANTNGGNSYIITNYNISFTPAQWQKELIIQVHIKTPSTIGNQWIMSNGSNWNNGIGITTNSDLNGAFWFMLGQSSTSRNVVFNGTTVPQTNTEYWVRLYKPNTENEAHNTLFQISTDGINWTTEDSIAIANIESNYTTNGSIRLLNLTGSNTYFQGGLYFKDTFISIDGEKVWYLIN